jgi:hypothetical protein
VEGEVDDEKGKEGVVVGGSRDSSLVGANLVEEKYKGFEGGSKGRVEEAVESSVVEDQESRVLGRRL